MPITIKVPVVTSHKYGIPQETLDWLESVNVMWFKNPMVCNVPYQVNGVTELMPYSAEYLKNTPLEEIKRGFDEHVNVLNHSDTLT
jgi:hypothetical protein